MTADALHARQLAVMADPVRIQILALILSDPRWEITVQRLAGPEMDADAIAAHLAAMAEVQLLQRQPTADGSESYSPSHDALVRFGALVLDRAPRMEEPAPVGHAELLHRIAEALAEDFRGVFSAETVERYVLESYDLLAARARVRTHLPVLTSRFATERLGALARAEGRTLHTSTDVLFVCVHNAGRSQIAAAALRDLAGDHVRVRTAGSSPAARINPQVARLLDRRGIAVVAEFPKPLTDEVVRASDYVITMGCGDACPVVPGRRYLDWGVADPTDQPDERVEEIIDDITRRVTALLNEVTAPR